jgi:signal transduction histidine kinase
LNLELSELKDEWTEDKIEDLKQALSILQTPKALQSIVSHPFDIIIQADGLDLKPEPIDTDILDNAQYKLDCKFKGGKRYWNIYSRKKANIGKWEKVKSSMVGGEIASVDASLGDAHFELYHFSLESDFYNKPIQKKAVTDFLEKWKGIKIFKDGVRVMPFGEVGHALWDWMGWERKTRYGVRPGALVGFVWLTSDNNPGIQEVTSRQGIAENDAYKSMKNDLVLDILRIYAGMRHDMKQEEKKEAVKVNLANKSQIALQHLQQEISAMTDIDPEDKQMVVSELKKVAKQIGEMQRESNEAHEEEVEQYVTDLDQYRPLATLGLSSLHFDHEVAPKLNTMNMGLKNLDHKMKKDGYDDKEILAKAIKQVSAIQGWGNYIEIFGKYLSGASARKAKEKLNIRSMVDELRESLKSLLIVKTREKNPKTVDINVEIAILGSISMVYANGAALASVFANLMTNSVKSLRESGRTNPRIKITVWKEHSNIFIEFEDNGIGVMDEYQERMWASFKSFFPAKRKGMGLGMTITKEIIEEQFHGEIKLDKTKYEGDHPGKGFARFLISIPAKELQGP